MEVSRCEDIDNAIWDDPDFESLSPHATLLYLWSFTNPRCDWSGMYKVSHAKMTESKVPLDAIPSALDELAAAGFAFYEDQVLWVRARVKRLRSRSPQMAKAVARDLRRIAAGHVLRQRWMDEYASDPWLREALADSYREGRDRVCEKPIGKGDSHTLSAPYRKGAGEGEGESSSSSSTEKIELPDDFPRELRPHLRVVFRVLRDLAARHHSKAVAPLSLAAVVTARSHKPLVRAAYDFVAYADGRAAPRKDVVAGYRNWLDKTDDLAGFELLGPDGLPTANGMPSAKRTTASSLLRDMGYGLPAEPDFVDTTAVEE